MKRWVLSSLAIVFFTFVMLMANAMSDPVLAQSPTPTPTPTPPPSVSVVQTSWNVNWGYSGSGTITCSNNTSYSGACDGVLSSSGTHNIFTFDAPGSITFGSGNNDIVVNIEAYIDSNIQWRLQTVNWDRSVTASGINYVSGSCHMIPAKTCGLTWRVANSNLHDGSVANGTTIHVIYSTAQINTQQCDQPQQTATIGSGTLDATNEAGDVVTVPVSDTIRITTSGGPWHGAPGATDRYDVAISWDGMSWMPLGAVALSGGCESQTSDPNYVDVQLTTISDTLHIRVNDISGQFADNDGGMDYTVETLSPPSSCADAYTLTEIVSSNVFASSVSGGEIPIPIQPGQVYAIEITDPGWYDGDTGGLSYAAQIAKTDGATATTMGLWQDLEAFNEATCVTDLGGGRYRVYFMGNVASSTFYSLRARDVDYTNNTGSLNYTLYSAVYTPTYPPCAQRYQPDYFVGSYRVNAWGGAGYQLYPGNELTPGVWVIETVGGPWINGWGTDAYPSWDVEISNDGGQTWTPLDSFGVCAYNYDINHVRSFFQVGSGYDPNQWLIRVSDPGGYYGDNTQSIDYNLYSALDQNQGTPSCSDVFTITGQIDSGSVSAGTATGKQISSIAPGAWYALEASTTQWADENAQLHTDAQLTNQPGWMLQSWFELSQYPGAACVETVGDHLRIYVQANQGDEYWIRANDSDGLFNNTGNVSYIVYGAQQTNPPPSLMCEANYELIAWTGSGDIYPRLDTGVVIQVSTGQTYALETADGPWNDGASDRYDVQVSADGSTWYSPGDAPFVSCVRDLDGNHVRMYFTAAQDTYYIRVADGGSFTDNSGLLRYKLWLANNVNVGKPPPPPPPPPGGEVGCNASCIRPDDPLALASWLEYGRCQITKFFAWCPVHSQALASVQEAFKRREPFATIYKLVDAIARVKAEVYAYDWGIGGGADPGAPIGSTWKPDDILPTLPDDSPYVNGRIEILKPSATYSTNCQTQMIPVLGPKLGAGVCFGADVMDKIGVLPWFQFIFDTFMIIILMIYLWKRWISIGTSSS